jgi:hypothetical protein
MGPSRSDLDNEQVHRIRVLGTGAADPTKQVGVECTVVRRATGVYRITFTKTPGTFVMVGGYMFSATTPADVKGQTLTAGDYTKATATAHGFIEISIWSSTFAADDLQATEHLDLSLVFRA